MANDLFKKIFLILGMLLIASSVYAEQKKLSLIDHNAFSGIYIGARLGVNQSQYRNHASSNQVLTDGSTNAFEQKNDMAKTAGVGEVILGLGGIWHQHFYGGVEGFISAGHGHVKSSASQEGANIGADHDSLFTKVNIQNFSYGFNFQPGLKINKRFLFFGVIGVALSKITLENNSQQYYVNNVLVSSNDKKSQWRPGLQLGLGAKVLLTPRLALDLLYRYTDYGDMQTTSTQMVQGTPSGTYAALGKTNIETNEVLLGLSYYLNSPPQSKDENTIQDDLTAFSGLYTGVRFGLLQPEFYLKHNSSINVDSAPFDTMSIQANAGGRNKPEGTLFLGYMKEVSWFNIAGEVFVNYANRFGKVSAGEKDSAENNQYTSTVCAQLNNVELGVDFRPGIRLNEDTLLYGRAGGVFTRKKLQTDVVFKQSGTNFAQLSQSNAENTIGLRLGFGLLERLNNHLGLTLDYIYTHYADANNPTETGGGIIEPNSPPRAISITATSKSTASLETQSFMLGLLYQW